MYVNSVCIVGGGSSGWMTAAALAKKYPEVNITLIESDKIPTIGVGESTLGHINRYFRLLELEDKDWMPQCDATYKTSIKFTNFRKDGDYFHYPFGYRNESRLPPIALFEMRWNKHFSKRDEMNHRTYAEVMHDQVIMTDMGKLTYNYDRKIEGFNFHTDTAYHMSADKFGQFLKNKFCKSIKHVIGNVEHVEYDETKANIKFIKTTKGILTADLYIDCTGFKSLLIGPMTSFISYNPMLKNNRAVTCHVPYKDKEKQMLSVTNCHGMNAGWTFEIPLWNEMGIGYVHSSEYLSWEEAEQELREYMGVDVKKFNRIEIRHGRQEDAWVGNCLGVGLSYGFIEPLESTGLMTTHENILRLIDTLDCRDRLVTNIDREWYNGTANLQLDTMYQFVAFHYASASRTDTKYWRDVLNNVSYLGNKLNVRGTDITGPNNTFQRIGKDIRGVHDVKDTIGILDGFLYIIAGQDYTFRSETLSDWFTWENPQDRASLHRQQEVLWSQYKKHREQLIQHIESLPSHMQFLQENIYHGTSRPS